MFQHDNARPHVAFVCTHFLMENDVHVLPWRAVSPGLNPIENVWDFLSICIRATCKPTNGAAVEGCTGGRMGGNSTGSDPTLLQVHEATDYYCP